MADVDNGVTFDFGVGHKVYDFPYDGVRIEYLAVFDAHPPG